MSKTNTACLDVIGIDYSVVAVAGDEYVVTYGTGEGTFAYAMLDITLESERYEAMPDAKKDEYDYSGGFCNCVDPVADVKVARELIRMGHGSIYHGGSCMPVIAGSAGRR
jgi:hypothetical protein